MKVGEMSDRQLIIAYAIADKQYTQAYKDKKEIKEEMKKRFEIDLEEGRR